MVFRKAVVFVLQNQGQEEGVARTPDAALPIEEAFQSVAQLFATHIKTGIGVVFALHHAQVAALFPFGHHRDKRFGRGFQQGCPFAVGFAIRNFLQLQVV